MSFSTIRVPLIIVAALAASASIAAVAIGADPVTGKFSGSEKTGFGGRYAIQFNVKDPARGLDKVQGFKFSGPICTSDESDKTTIVVPRAMKVKPNGKFAFDGEPKGVDEYDFSVDGKFSARKTAKGTLFVGACPLAGEFEFVIKKGGGDSVENVPADF